MKTGKIKLKMVAVSCMALLLSGCGEKKQSVDTMEFLKVAKLGTMKIVFEDAAFATQKKAGIGPGNYVAMDFLGEAILGVDLAKAKISRKSRNLIEIFLPPPEVINTRIDFSKSKIIDREKGAFRQEESVMELGDQLRRQELEAMRKNAMDPKLIETVKILANLSLKDFYKSVDSEVVIVWRKK